MRDFRCYAGLTTIAFATDPQRNTTVIEGTNGAGKTSILHALNFALYGRSAVPTGPQAPLINNTVLTASNESSPAEARVILEFTDDKHRYKLSRKVRGFMAAERVLYLPERSDEVTLTVTEPDGNTSRDPFPDQSIERMLPSPIRTFFLFDGDRIADFTQPGRERDEKISKAVNDVLHIEALSRAATRTAKLASDKNRALERAGAPSVEKTAMEIRLQESEIERRRDLASKMRLEIDQLIGRVGEIDAELISINEVAKLADMRKTLEAKRGPLLERISQLRQRLSVTCIAAIPALVAKQVTTASRILSKYKTSHEIPARIQSYFLQELLRKGQCICGRGIGDHSPEQSELQALLKTLVPDSLQDVATALASRLRPFTDDSENRITDTVDLLKLIKESEIDVTRVDKEIERIGGDIDATALDRSTRLNQDRSIVTRRLLDLKGHLSMADRDMDNATKTKRILEERQKTELQKVSGLQGLTREWNVAKECAEALKTAKGVLEERLRATLSADATAILKNLASTDKKYFFSEVKVEPNYLLRVLDFDGRDVRSQLSMGETQVSSLAFMLAMTRLGGQEAPLVVDTPLARLDKSVRTNAAHWLPKLTPQLVLLVTDEEFTPAVASQLAPDLGCRMRLLPTATGTQVEVLSNG